PRRLRRGRAPQPVLPAPRTAAEPPPETAPGGSGRRTLADADGFGSAAPSRPRPGTRPLSPPGPRRLSRETTAHMRPDTATEEKADGDTQSSGDRRELGNRGGHGAAAARTGLGRRGRGQT